MNKERIQTLSLLLVGIVSGGIIVLVTMEHILPVILPFIIAWAVAFAVRGPARRLSEKTRVPERVVRVFMAIFTTLFTFGAITLLLWQIVAAVWSFLSKIGEGNAIYDILTKLSNPDYSVFGDAIPEGLAERISEALEKMLSGALTRLAEAVTGWVGGIPNLMFFLLVTVISLIYFSLDLERINTWIKSLFPERFGGRLSKIREGIFTVGGKYIRSYALILLITFGVMVTGFFLIGIKHALVLAVIISLLDILPVIGVGTVLVPWSIFEIVTGNHARGIALAVLFVVNLVIRQFAEPKIVGKNLDIHPVLTLLLLYVGYALFGIQGLVTVPILAAVLVVLLKENSTPKIDEGKGGK